MATTLAVEDRSMSIGRVFGRAFATLGDNPLVMFGIAFLFRAVPGALLGWGLAEGRQATGFDALSGLFWYGSGGIIGLILSTITQGAMVRATTAYSEGRRAGFVECALTGLRVFLPLIGLGLVLAFGVVLGLGLLIVPGVMIYVMWSVAAPALVEERRGVFAAFARSRFLTRGARWRVFALELVVLVFYWLASATLGVVTILFLREGSGTLAGFGLWSMLLTALTQTIGAAIWGAIQTSLYIELRLWKDGPADAALADIFA